MDCISLHILNVCRCKRRTLFCFLCVLVQGVGVLCCAGYLVELMKIGCYFRTFHCFSSAFGHLNYTLNDDGIDYKHLTKMCCDDIRLVCACGL